MTIVVHKVETIDVIDKAIAIVIDAIASNLSLVDPDTALNIFVQKVEASVYEGDYYLTRRDLQCFQLCPGILEAHALWTPLLRPNGIDNSLQRHVDLFIEFNETQLIAQLLFDQSHGLVHILPTAYLCNVNAHTGQMVPASLLQTGANFLKEPPCQAPRIPGAPPKLQQDPLVAAP